MIRATMDRQPWLGEYEALTGGIGVADLTDRTRIELRGGDRMRFLHSFCTNDIQRLTPGSGCEAFVTNHQGKTIGHIFVYCQAEALLLDAVARQAGTLIAHLERFVISDDVTFHDQTEITGELLVAGPQAATLLQRLCGEQVPQGPGDHKVVTIAGQKACIACVDFIRPSSYFIAAPRVDIDAIGQAINQAGVVRCGTDAVEAARLESGTPLFGHDITEENLPQEIRRDAQAISFTKGCYLGQETVARIDAMGHVNRLLAGVRWPDGRSPIPQPGTELKVGDKVVGHVTSVAWSPRLDQPLAIALVRRLSAQPGTRLDSPIGLAEIVALPLS